jgi:hypothetical protein
MMKLMPAPLAALLLVMTALGAGCGGATATPESSPSSRTPTPEPSRTGPLDQVAGVRGYLQEVKPITSDLAATVSSLSEAVKGLSSKPDDTWTTSADKLDHIAVELGGEASALEALSPPAGLQPLQDAAVKGIQTGRSAVTTMADALRTRASTPATSRSVIQAGIAELQTQLAALSRMLNVGVEALLGSPHSTPSP